MDGDVGRGAVAASGASGMGRRPGRPPTYIFDRPDEELSEHDRKVKNAVLKRRNRQNRSYQRKKIMKKSTDGRLVSDDGMSTVGLPSASGLTSASLGLGLDGDVNQKDDLLMYSEMKVGGNIRKDEDGLDVVDVITRVESNEDGLHPSSDDLNDNLGDSVLQAVKGTMDRNNSLARSAGFKDVLFGNLRDRFFTLNKESQGALRSLAVFPRDFDMASAVAVMGGEVADGRTLDLLQPLFGSGFITSTSGRFELNQVTRLFLTEESPFKADPLSSGTWEPPVQRYISHFQKMLSNLTDPNIHKLGFAREHAMHVFDTERQNMDYSLELCRLTGPERLREFLAAGAAVMRYCVDASTRIQYLRSALDEEGDHDGRNYGSPLTENLDQRPSDRRNVVRLELARAEALCDNQALEDAEEPLKKAMELMDGDFTKSSTGIMDTVLVLLLFAGVKINLSKTDEGHKLLVQALKILNKIGLGKTTLAVNALTNLVTIYVQRNELEKANYVATELLNTLQVMRYDKMPIYADALGVLAMVRMASGDYIDAARQFGAGLEIVAGWGSKQWTSVPVQHCLDLDIWLMEGLAISLNLQGLHKDAKYMVELASQERESRRLRALSYDILRGTDVVPTWLCTSRHLY